MNQDQAKLLEPGVYRLLWRVGGSDIAIVGEGIAGQRWFVIACRTIHWTQHPMYGGTSGRRYLVGRTDWSRVERAVPVVCVDVPLDVSKEGE
jgi:hypothetical protein